MINSQSSAAYNLVDCVVCSAQFAGGELTFYEERAELLVMDAEGQTASPLSVMYEHILHFRLSRADSHLRITVPRELVMAWARENGFASQLHSFFFAFEEDEDGHAAQAVKRQSNEAIILTQLSAEDMTHFLTRIAPMIAANRRARSASRISVTEPLPISVYVPDPSHARSADGEDPDSVMDEGASGGDRADHARGEMAERTSAVEDGSETDEDVASHITAGEERRARVLTRSEPAPAVASTSHDVVSHATKQNQAAASLHSKTKSDAAAGAAITSVSASTPEKKEQEVETDDPHDEELSEQLARLEAEVAGDGGAGAGSFSYGLLCRGQNRRQHSGGVATNKALPTASARPPAKARGLREREWQEDERLAALLGPAPRATAARGRQREGREDTLSETHAKRGGAKAGDHSRDNDGVKCLGEDHDICALSPTVSMTTICNNTKENTREKRRVGGRETGELVHTVCGAADTVFSRVMAPKMQADKKHKGRPAQRNTQVLLPNDEQASETEAEQSHDVDVEAFVAAQSSIEPGAEAEVGSEKDSAAAVNQGSTKVSTDASMGDAGRRCREMSEGEEGSNDAGTLPKPSKAAPAASRSDTSGQRARQRQQIVGSAASAAGSEAATSAGPCLGDFLKPHPPPPPRPANPVFAAAAPASRKRRLTTKIATEAPQNVGEQTTSAYNFADFTTSPDKASQIAIPLPLRKTDSRAKRSKAQPNQQRQTSVGKEERKTEGHGVEGDRAMHLGKAGRDPLLFLAGLDAALPVRGRRGRGRGGAGGGRGRSRGRGRGRARDAATSDACNDVAVEDDSNVASVTKRPRSRNEDSPDVLPIAPPAKKLRARQITDAGTYTLGTVPDTKQNTTGRQTDDRQKSQAMRTTAFTTAEEAGAAAPFAAQKAVSASRTVDALCFGLVAAKPTSQWPNPTVKTDPPPLGSHCARPPLPSGAANLPCTHGANANGCKSGSASLSCQRNPSAALPLFSQACPPPSSLCLSSLSSSAAVAPFTATSQSVEQDHPRWSQTPFPALLVSGDDASEDANNGDRLTCLHKASRASDRQSKNAARWQDRPLLDGPHASGSPSSSVSAAAGDAAETESATDAARKMQKQSGPCSEAQQPGTHHQPTEAAMRAAQSIITTTAMPPPPLAAADVAAATGQRPLCRQELHYPSVARDSAKKARVRRAMRCLNVLSQNVTTLHEHAGELRGILLAMLDDGQL